MFSVKHIVFSKVLGYDCIHISLIFCEKLPFLYHLICYCHFYFQCDKKNASLSGHLLCHGSVLRCSMRLQRTGSGGSWMVSIMKSRQLTPLRWSLKSFRSVRTEHVNWVWHFKRSTGGFFQNMCIIFA